MSFLGKALTRTGFWWGKGGDFNGNFLIALNVPRFVLQVPLDLAVLAYCDTNIMRSKVNTWSDFSADGHWCHLGIP